MIKREETIIKEVLVPRFQELSLTKVIKDVLKTNPEISLYLPIYDEDSEMFNTERKRTPEEWASALKGLKRQTTFNVIYYIFCKLK